MGEKVNRRGQVSDLIATGLHTKAEIAELIGVNPASVSSQLTYLRWMGKFIKYDDDKKLKFCTKEEYDAWQETLNANRKVKAASSRTPEEQAEVTFKAVAKQESQLSSWEKKLAQITSDLVAEPDDEDLLELEAEAQANITLLKIKIKRNKARQEELPEYVPAAEVDETDAVDVPDPDEDEDDALESSGDDLL